MNHIQSVCTALFTGVELNGTAVMWFVVIFMCGGVWFSLRRSYTRRRS